MAKQTGQTAESPPTFNSNGKRLRPPPVRRPTQLDRGPDLVDSPHSPQTAPELTPKRRKVELSGYRVPHSSDGDRDCYGNSNSSSEPLPREGCTRIHRHQRSRPGWGDDARWPLTLGKRKQSRRHAVTEAESRRYRKRLRYCRRVRLMDLPMDTIRYILLFLEPVDWARGTSLVCKKLRDVEKYCWSKVGTEVESLYKYGSLSFMGKTRSGTSDMPSPLRQQRVITSCLKAVNNLSLRLESSDVDGLAFEHILNKVKQLSHLELVDCPFTFRPTTNTALFRESCPPQAKLKAFKVSHTYFTACGHTLRRLLGCSNETLENFQLRRKTPFECSYCSKKSLSKYQKCARCFLANYCSKECQLKAWNVQGEGQHGVVCRGHAGQHMATLATARQLSPSMMRTIIGCNNLRELDLSWMFRCSDAAIAIITSSCKRLTELRLNGCTGITDESIAHIVKNLPDLEVLEVRMCRRVTDEGVRQLARNAKSLRELDICRCYRVTDESLRLLAEGCPNLTRLNVACGLRGQHATWCISMETIQYLLDRLHKLEYLALVSPDANNTNGECISEETATLLGNWRNADGKQLETQIFPEPDTDAANIDDEDDTPVSSTPTLEEQMDDMKTDQESPIVPYPVQPHTMQIPQVAGAHPIPVTAAPYGAFTTFMDPQWIPMQQPPLIPLTPPVVVVPLPPPYGYGVTGTGAQFIPNFAFANMAEQPQFYGHLSPTPAPNSNAPAPIPGHVPTVTASYFPYPTSTATSQTVVTQDVGPTETTQHGPGHMNLPLADVNSYVEQRYDVLDE